jgi:hypothetical protein
MAIFILFLGIGMTHLRSMSVHLPRAVGALLLVILFTQLLFGFQQERAVQAHYEEGVRVKVGETLDRLMSEQDSATFEPLGYIGWQVRPKTVYDYPGLGSPTSVKVLSAMEEPSMEKLIAQLLPSFLVLRPNELEDLQAEEAETSSRYRVVERFSAEAGPRLRAFNVEYFSVDNEFIILERTR